MLEITPLQPIQVVTFIVALAVFVTVVAWAHVEIRRGMFPYLIGPISFSLHLVVFYSVLILREWGLFITQPLTIWSAYLRLHGLLTMLGMLLMIYFRCAQRGGVWNNG